MAGDLTVRVHVEGVAQTIERFKRLPDAAMISLKERTQLLARVLADKAETAGRAEGSQAAKVAGSVGVGRTSALPVISAGGGRASGLVFGSEFGMNRRSGWYAAGKYRGSIGRQYKPHRGANSYWFFKTMDADGPEAFRAWQAVADDIVRAFGGRVAR